MTANMWYELINSACDCCSYWQGLFERGAHRVLTTVDPWIEYRLSHEDYYRYISYINEDDYE
jgi:hypothetical protein